MISIINQRSRELRFRIYELADVIPPGPFAYGRSLPPIFHTSRQFYAETVELLKHRGDFHIYTPTAGYQWLRAPSCAQLRHVTVFIDTITTTATTTAAADASDYRWDLFVRDVLARLPGLRLRLRSASVEVDAAALWAMVREIPQCAENERTCVEEGNGHARALVIMPKGEGVVGEESRYVSDTMDMRTGGLARA
ncbi:hypothetical protein BX600DRAFT_449069 [Xylariales sp. PMI_506]|nr:hypothetical protein BX600DRAFT_449069 [Xylariales sp. PMI_506]